MSLNEETDDWFFAAKKEHKKIFSELDVLLRSLDRFFHAENLPITRDDLTARNFHDELNAVRNVILRVLALLEIIIPESKKNAYWFQRFTESKFLSNHLRDVFKEKMYKQDTPEKALYILYDIFVNLKGIVTDLLKTGQMSYLGYANIGKLLSKEIRGNAFFNPFKKDMNPDLDKIENREISDIVRSIDDREAKKYISLLYLYLFRLLRYLDHMDGASRQPVALHSALLILVLVRAEINMLIRYLKKADDHIQDEELKILLKSIFYQFSMETKRVYLQELEEVLRKKASYQIKGKIENSQGILKNLIEQSTIQLVQFFRPGIQGKEIFESFTTRLFHSVKLREDLFVLYSFLALLEEKINLPGEGSDILKTMKIFMHYFESTTFKLLRYDDYYAFVSFFSEVFSINEHELNKNLEKIHNFKIFLEMTLQQITYRAELKDMPLDTKKAEKILKQYL